MILLVHGGWHGAWAWRFVLKHLMAENIPAAAVDLPGHGTSVQSNRNSLGPHLFSRDCPEYETISTNFEDRRGVDWTSMSTGNAKMSQKATISWAGTSSFFNVTLKSYVEAVVEHVRASPTPVILVGHSMAGMVISQVAEQCPDAVAHLVYVCGFVPNMNGTLVDETAQFSTDIFAHHLFFDIKNCRISLKNMARPQDFFYNTTPTEVVSWALPQLQDQPLKPFTQPVSLTPLRFGSVPKTYITCTLDQSIPLVDQNRMRAKISCQEIILPSDHSPFLSMPEELSSILNRISTGF